MGGWDSRGLLVFALLAACGGDDSNSLFGSDDTSAATGGPGGDASAGDTSGSTSTSGEDSTGEQTTFTFDVGSGIDLGGSVAPQCGDLETDEPGSLGCEFWAVRVPVYTNLFQPESFGIGVGNPFEKEVTVKVEDLRGPNGTLRLVTEFVVGPHESKLVTLNGPGSLLPGESHEVAAMGYTQNAAFRITSNEPITAMQINPVGGAPSYVPEASMLLPTTSLGEVYYGIGYEAYGAQIPFPIPGGFSGWVAVVGIVNGTTIQTVDGPQVIDAFDVYTFNPDDPTGYFVSADKPIAVFSGTTCSNIPNATGWCDHLEEQLIPVAAWGTHYVGARHPHRMPETNPTPEQVYWRVIAGKDNTQITLTPPVGNSPIFLAKAGDYADFNASVSFVAESDDDHPFMLVQYMGGGQAVYDAEACGGNDPPTGDPYMLQMVPTAQWLEQLAFLTDDSYARDFVTISRKMGTTVELDCMGVVPDEFFTPVVGTEYEVANVYLDRDGAGGEGNCVDGQQYLTASDRVGIAVGGFDCAASYGYPGGLSLAPLWVPPHEPPG